MATPLGVIVIWSGAIVDIPFGWVLCDGNNGTPNLTDRFLIGAGGFFAPGATGGTVNHTHNFTTDGHTHGFPAGIGLASGPTFSNVTDIQQDTGTTNPALNLPPFYALAYIMKI